MRARLEKFARIAALAAILASGVSHAGDFTTFESGQVRPLALSADGDTLYAVNTPDNRLEIFDVGPGGIAWRGSVPVGLEPVAVAERRDGEVWVVNHLSDSVSVVEIDATPRVVRTLLVGDEPNDIVFAGPARSLAFVTTAHRGQNSPHPRGDYETPGIGRADVWIFDATALGAGLGGDPLRVVSLFGDKPRALAVSPDGARVYAAIFHSGNQTTTVHEDLVCDGGESAPPCEILGTPSPGGLPAPNESLDGIPGPETGLIVQFDEATGTWQDEIGRDWSSTIRFSLPDLDVFELDATDSPGDVLVSHAHVGTILFDMAVNPRTGALYVSNTEAINRVRFEGEGLHSSGAKTVGEPSSVRGHLAEARITVIDQRGVHPRHLNKHIDYEAPHVDPSIKAASLATPLGMAVSSDGRTLYVAAFGSGVVGVLDADALETNRFAPDASRHLEVSGGGPTGLVLDERRGRLYVLTRFDDAISVIDLDSGEERAHVALHNPEPAHVVAGRPFLYDARLTSSNGEASCAACHVFGDVDSLAWDLGDPDGAVVPNPNPGAFVFLLPFHPMKGPMTTQTFRGMRDSGGMHWRADRSGLLADPPTDMNDSATAFGQFDGAFGSLLGREEGPLSAPEMQAFTAFALEIESPPNPIRLLDGSLRPAEAIGELAFFRNRADQNNCTICFFTCNICHRIDPVAGSFGTNRTSALTNQSQSFKVPHFRNLYQKVGMFGMPSVPMLDQPDSGETGPQIRGFGFLHDGATDTLPSFLGFFRDQMAPNEEFFLERFLMAAPNNLAPIVGQQVTLGAGSGADALARARLLIERAQATYPAPGDPDALECDLIAKLSDDAGTHGFAMISGGAFLPDDGTRPVSATSLLQRGQTADHSITFTCTPPGSGLRAGIDRDRDGVLDGLDDCPAASDPEQSDSDGDGIGDACDVCPAAADPEQADSDRDGIGDACDSACGDGRDNDGDGLVDFPADPACADIDDLHESPRNDVEVRIAPREAALGLPLFADTGIVEVWLLGREDIDVSAVDVSSARFGPAGVAPLLGASLRSSASIGDGIGSPLGTSHPAPRPASDLDGDGLPDLRIVFPMDGSGLAPGDTRACVRFEIEEVAFESCGEVDVSAIGMIGPVSGGTDDIDLSRSEASGLVSRSGSRLDSRP